MGNKTSFSVTVRRAVLYGTFIFYFAIGSCTKSQLTTDKVLVGKIEHFVDLKTSKDGLHFGYVTLKNEKWAAVIDGEVSPEWDEVMSPVFIGDGGKAVYAAKKNNKWHIIKDGVVGSELYGDDIGKDSLVFSPNGNHMAYLAKKGKSSVVVLDGVPGPEYDEILIYGTDIFALNGSRAAYAAKKVNKCFVVVDGIEGPEWDEVRQPVFSSDGLRIAYTAKKGEKWIVVVDNVAGPEWGDEIRNVIFSLDGKRLAFTVSIGRDLLHVEDSERRLLWLGVAKKGPVETQIGKSLYMIMEGARWHMVVDEKESQEWEGLGIPAFSDDGKQIAYAAKKGKKCVMVVDGVTGPEWDDISEYAPRFSSDGKWLAYLAKKGEKQLVVINNIKGPTWDHIFPYGPLFRNDGKIEYLALQGKGSLFRVQHLLKK